MKCRPRCFCTLIVLIWVLVVPGIVPAATLYVDSEGKAGYSTIQEAVDAAVDGDTIVINPGTYTGRGNRDIDLRAKSISIQSTDPEDSGIVETTIIDCAATTSDPHRAFIVNNTTAEICGLTIRNGLAQAGGAILCQDGVLALENCRLMSNATLAGGPGGALCCYDAAVNVAGCHIEDNRTGDGADSRSGIGETAGDGGGIYSSNSVVYVSDSIITGNMTGAGGDSDILPGNGGNGGGIYADALVVIDSTISNNVCGNGGTGPEGGLGGIGGGIFSARASIDTSIIEGNIAGSAGENSYGGKEDDIQEAAGGGIYCSDSIQIFSSLIAGNRGSNGAGIWCSRGVINLCTIVGNGGPAESGSKVTEALGGGIFCSNETIVTNSILWDNEPDQILGHNCDNVLYCDIEGSVCQTGLGVLSEDPRFVEAGYWDDGFWIGGDYHLAADSPCIDGGDPAYTVDSEETDLDGSARLNGIAVDMGAYEQTNLVAVYRFWSPKTSKHFFTINEAEKDKLIADFSDVWTFEGPVYYVYAQATGSAVVPVYRLWSSKTGSHFWTISESEKASLLENENQGWIDEGIVFYVYSDKMAGLGLKPVYRFWSGALGSHLYTISESEKDKLIAEYSNAWTYEGIVWYAFDSISSGGDNDPGTEESNIYEFVNTIDPVSFSLELTAKIDGKPTPLDTTELTFASAVGSMQMNVDLDSLTTQLNALRVESETLNLSAVAGDRVSGQGEFSFDLAISGSFDSPVARGPYEIDSRSLTFPVGMGAEDVSGDEVFTITGSATINGEKSNINLNLNSTGFELDGVATFVESNASDLLDMSMDGPFKWSRQGYEDLLFERSFKGRVLQVYVTAVKVHTTGLWNGKQVQSEDEKDEKDEKTGK